MRSAESGRWKPFTSAFNPGQTHLWPCSDATGGKSCEAVLRFCRRIRISFSARLETPAMGNTEQNCGEQSRPYKPTEKPITTLKNVFCSVSTGNMGWEPSSLIELACLL